VLWEGGVGCTWGTGMGLSGGGVFVFNHAIPSPDATARTHHSDLMRLTSSIPARSSLRSCTPIPDGGAEAGGRKAVPMTQREKTRRPGSRRRGRRDDRSPRTAGSPARTPRSDPGPVARTYGRGGWLCERARALSRLQPGFIQSNTGNTPPGIAAVAYSARAQVVYLMPRPRAVPIWCANFGIPAGPAS